MKVPRSTGEALRIIERFDSLPIEKRLEVFRKLSSQAREELIQTILNPGEIVRRISEEEMYYTIKHLGTENALNLVRATTGKQLKYLLDLELWRKDMFDEYAARRWLEIIDGVGTEKILQFVQVADPELLLICLARLIKVSIRNPDVDLLEQTDTLPAFTLDDLFFVEFRSPAIEETVKHFLEVIFRWNTDYYFGLMEEIARGIHLENEERARKWRQARLADHGFPEFDEATEIYHYLRPSEVLTSPDASTRREADDYSDPRSLLEYPLIIPDTEDLFRRCLNEIEDSAEKDRISMELAHLANKVMVADAREPGSLDEMQRTLRKVSGYINIALEELCGDDTSVGLELLRSNHMEILFRRGFSMILDLRKQAHKLIREYEGGVENLGHPLAELIKGLIQKRPFYAGNVVGEKNGRDFRSVEDIHIIQDLMDTSAIEDRWQPI
ncbi:MAG: DUF6178 family protein [Deltaproteobacteria bacterium]